jgi:type I restriction enzyme M protein
MNLKFDAMMMRNNNMTEFSEKAKWVFGLFDKIRGHVSVEDYSVILFLLYLRSENLIDEDSDSNKDICAQSSLEKQQLERLLSVREIFEEKLSKISKQALSIIYKEIRTLDPEDDNLNSGTDSILSIGYNVVRNEEYDRVKTGFEEIFELALYRIASSQGRKSGEYIQPSQLTEFVNGYILFTDGLKVYNPFAGLASFINGNIKASSILAQEVNTESWAIGQLRLLISRTNADFRCEDSIHFWPTNEKFDLIVSNPPFGARLNTDLKKLYPDYRIMEEFLLGKSIDSLSDKGKAVVVLSVGALFNRGTMQKLRQRLIQEDLIESIISFPGGLLYHTSTPFIVMVVAKQKLQPDKIKMVDASNYIKSLTSKDKEIDVENLLKEVRKNENSEAVRIISNDDVIQNDYNLSVFRYFQEEIDGVKLKDLLSNIRGSKSDLPENGKFIRIRDLKDDKIDFELNAAAIEESPLNRSDLHKIDCSCLLLAARWNTLKPTFFHFDSNPVFIGSDILAFHVDESAVDVAYLINELQADYVQAQLDSYRMGTTIPYIRRDDLLEVTIKLTSLEEQKAKVKGISELSDKIKQLQEERNTLAHDVSSKLYESVSTIKHSLGKPLLNIGSSLRNIENALSRLNADWERAKLNERYELTIKDTFDSIYSNLELINSMLRNNESVLDVSNYELTEIDFLSFIRGYVNRIKSAEKVNVITKLDIHPDIKNQLKNKVLILANAELLEIGLNAIVENANMHAFTDDSIKYNLEFRVSICVTPSKKKQVDEAIGRFDTYIKVEVANNGKPFPKNYFLEKLIRKNSFAGETGNTGQGGFDLNEIIKYHNNGVSTLDLITDDFTAEFSSTYLFLIPLNG